MAVNTAEISMLHFVAHVVAMRLCFENKNQSCSPPSPSRTQMRAPALHVYKVHAWHLLFSTHQGTGIRRKTKKVQLERS